MSVLKNKLKLFSSSSYQWWRIATFLMYGLMLGSILMSGFFIYNYTFRTLADAHTIVLLNTDSVVNTVNMDNYQKAVKLVNTKSATSTIPEGVRNIFVFPVEIPTSTSSSTYATPQ